MSLRTLLKEQFPEAHRQVVPTPAPAPVPTAVSVAETPDEDRSENHLSLGVASLDSLGVLAPGVLTEITCRRPGGGAGMLIAGVVRATAEKRRHLALIDGADSFDPQSFEGIDTRGLLWARCRRRVDHAVKSADLLLRDGNLPLVLLDLQLCAPRDIRAIPGSSWYRLRSLAEKTGALLLTLTPAPVIPAARIRLELDHTWPLDAIDPLPLPLPLLSLTMKITRQQYHDTAPESENVFAKAG